MFPFHEKGDRVVLLLPFTSCVTFAFVSFGSLCNFLVNVNILQVVPFTSFEETILTLKVSGSGRVLPGFDQNVVRDSGRKIRKLSAIHT